MVEKDQTLKVKGSAASVNAQISGYNYSLNIMTDAITAGISTHSNVIYELLQIRRKEIRTASDRIAYLFLELLEQQFLTNDRNNSIELRQPSQFARRLNVHVNHLNRALKETFSKTTSEIISTRVLYEAKRLLEESGWNIADIAYSLRFTEATHFNNFFKKRTQISPRKFRRRILQSA